MGNATPFGRETGSRKEAATLQAPHKLYPQLIEVDPLKIKFNPLNPRKHGGAEYHRLKTSVEEVGVVQMPTVRQMAGGFYECIDGEARVKAAQEAGLARIWVVCVGIVSDTDALTMLQAANEVRQFSYLAGCKGLANLHRQGLSLERIARSLGVSTHTVQIDIAVGYFPEQTLALIQNSLPQSSRESLQDKSSGEGLQGKSSEEDRLEKRSITWSAHTFTALLPLRIQMKSIQGREKGVAPTLDGVYDYTEVHRAIEKIVHGEILTHEQLHAYVERRRRELFEAHFDKALQQKLQAERERAELALKEAHAQDLHSVEETTAHRYEQHITQLQQQLADLETRHREIVKEVARRPELVAKREAELQHKCQEVEEERCKLLNLQRQMQEEKQRLREQLENELRAQADKTLQAQRAAMEKEFKDAHADLEAYYAKKDQQRQMKAEKTFRQAIAHGTELLAQSQQWLLLLITPGMLQGLSWLSEAETVSLLGQIQTVRDTLEKAEEVVLHGHAPEVVSSEEGEVDNGDDYKNEPSKNMGHG